MCWSLEPKDNPLATTKPSSPHDSHVEFYSDDQEHKGCRLRFPWLRGKVVSHIMLVLFVKPTTLRFLDRPLYEILKRIRSQGLGSADGINTISGSRPEADTSDPLLRALGYMGGLVKVRFYSNGCKLPTSSLSTSSDAESFQARYH